MKGSDEYFLRLILNYGKGQTSQQDAVHNTGVALIERPEGVAVA
ncbi:hypothetical protein [Occallatibacter savannae]|nr:hypothetical protein [Occallatibacter savannae]